MNNDRELLEPAAKAAGIEGLHLGSGGINWWIGDTGRTWNPLTDDGDALRLAVKLRIKVRFNTALNQGLAWHYDKEYAVNAEEHNNDPYAATRRAIVRAAAEIGRNMK